MMQTRRMNWFLILLTLVPVTESFGLVLNLKGEHGRVLSTVARHGNRPFVRGLGLQMAEEDREVEIEKEAVAKSEEKLSEEAKTEEDGEDEPKEDPELLALKEEIAKLESTLKEKRRKVASTRDRADDYTKAGYARKVAEMENMRRTRRMLQSSSTAGATASLLTEFLPLVDKLMELNEKYSADEFGKQYGALLSAAQQVFSNLGVSEYSINAGDLIDKSRMVAVDSEHSDNLPAGTVLRSLRTGLELDGNVMRFAECVESLGPMPAATDEAEEDSSEKGIKDESDGLSSGEKFAFFLMARR